MFGTLQRLGARPGDIDDLLQEIFVALHRNWPTLDTTRSLRPWLFGVAFRVIRTHRRRRAREAPYAEMDPEDGSPTPEAWLQGQESLALLWAAFEHVPVSRRSVADQARPGRSRRHRDRPRALDDEVRGLCAALQGTQGAGLRRSAVAEGGVVEMKRHGSDLDPELEAFLTPRKIQREAPPELRARVLARARATVAGGGATPRFRRDLPLPPAPRVRVRAVAVWFWIAFAASVRDGGRRGRSGGGAPRPTRALAADRRAGACGPGAERSADERRHPGERTARTRRRDRGGQAAPPRASRRESGPVQPPSSICFSARMARTRDATSRPR